MTIERFVGREFEQSRIQEAANSGEASILIVYGRRRIGKTELIEHSLGQRKLIKMEGAEGGNTKDQMERVLFQLSAALNDPLIARLQFSNWFELFCFMGDKFQQGKVTLYFEELQWLAEYKDAFISDLKICWDNRFRHNRDLVIVLCGSSPSFMINQVVHSKSLYNRSSYEINLQEFSLRETREFLKNRSNREIMNAYLSVGGVPEYLKRLNKYSSLELGLCKASFTKDSYLSQEHERIFISSFSNNRHYREIIDFLSQVKFATRAEIEGYLKISGGGKLTNILTDLELCGFIESYTPYYIQSKSKLNRYSIADNYLQFYFKFIKPIANKIRHGDFNKNPSSALNKESYQKWLGFSFERFCRKNHRLIAKIIGFSAVRYLSGAFYDRKSESLTRGFQIDLIYERADHVMTVCEIKYLQGKTGTEVIDEFESKLSVIRNKTDSTIEKVLISANGASESLIERNYFDYIITLEDLFNSAE